MQRLFDNYIRHLEVECNASPYTIRNYANDLLGNYARGSEKGFFQFLRFKHIGSLEDVDKAILRDYISWLMQQGVVKASIARKLSAIRSLYRYLVREGLLPHNQLETTSTPKLDRRLPSFLTIVEVEKLLQAPDLSTPHGQRDKALLELLYASGIRVSELVNLDIEHVYRSTSEIRVWGKGNKERMVLMGEPAAEALTKYLNQARPKLLGDKRNNALFLNRYGERILERRVQKILDEYSAKAGLGKKVHPHMLRHTFATHMLDGGADLRVVQELLGHANLTSTQIYTHVTKSQARKVYLSAHPMAQEGGRELDNS
ncbi:site-specific tyrosine recombinase/integron integrase [Chloroflexota bacterium]